MELGLRTKTALVLAGSRGLGKACAIALAAEGAKVLTVARTNADIIADVTDPAQLTAAFAKAGPIDILINNAGGPPFGPFESFDDDQWHKALELNLMSAVRATRLALPGMKERCWGRIINIVSFGTKSVLPGSVLSTAGRLGIIGMSKLLSDEVAQYGITVNNVASGFILTDRVREINKDLEALAASIPAKRIGEPAELAALVTFLASEQAAYITGTTIPIDGGAIRSIVG